MTEFPNWFEITAKENFEDLVPKEVSLSVLQIGVYTGDATQWLLENRNIEIIDDVDTWGGSLETAHESIDFDEVYNFYKDRIEKIDPNAERVRSWHMSSNSFFNNIYDNEYDLIYIDGDHTATQTVIDGLNAFKHLVSGGLIAFDDLTWFSEKGEFYAPKRGIEAVVHVLQDQAEVVAANSQLWLRKN
jgi:hypothetical protein